MGIEKKRPPNTSTDVRLCTSVMLSPDLLYAVVFPTCTTREYSGTFQEEYIPGVTS